MLRTVVVKRVSARPFSGLFEFVRRVRVRVDPQGGEKTSLRWTRRRVPQGREVEEGGGCMLTGLSPLSS